MKKLVLLLTSTLAISAPAFGQLGYDRAEMEARYGKEIHPSNVIDEGAFYPESVKVNGAVVRKPTNYWASYEDKEHDYQLYVLYNSRGVVTDIRYQHVKGRAIDDKEFHWITGQNGFQIGRSLEDYQDWHGVTLEPLYPINDRNEYLEVDWATEDGKEDWEFPGEPKPKRTVVTQVRIVKAEALADIAQNAKSWQLFRAAVDANPKVDEEVARKWREAAKKDFK